MACSRGLDLDSVKTINTITEVAINEETCCCDTSEFSSQKGAASKCTLLFQQSHYYGTTNRKGTAMNKLYVSYIQFSIAPLGPTIVPSRDMHAILGKMDDEYIELV